MTEAGASGPPHDPGGPDDTSVGRRWLFGAAAFDELSFELLMDGQPVEVERKPLEVLGYLLRHAGEVVTKDELAEQLWPGRILTESTLSRCVSLLRRALKDEDHGLIKTVHGYGYRLVAQISVEAAKVPTAPVFRFAVGDSPPLRPHWKLVERLGTGGHGEAWLARHEKTSEARVFKFALNQGALVSLKREITLYRLLRETLGTSAAVVAILEWNLEEAPYFLEMEYVEGRDLRTWADAQGGIAKLPLPQRLELTAQVAEIVAAAHSVGVLHKDLKPENILIQPHGQELRIRLCDFGSGGVLDPERLTALGITRLSFTKTRVDTGGTPLYLAPEVVGGQPFTVKADVYALGMLLYQMVVGDFAKPLAPGWEVAVEDELLREDIAESAAGDPARRLADPALLAERLRGLDTRKRQRAADRVARERAERARRALQELKRLRVFAAVLVALATVAITEGVAAYRARNEAVAASASAKAINDFLMDDVLAVDPAVERPRDASYESLLNRAAVQADTRFTEQPEAAGSVHWLLGRRFHELGQIEMATIEYERAAALFENLYGRAAEPTMLALDRLSMIYVDRGRIPEAMAISAELRRNWTARHGESDLSTLLLRERIARILIAAGDFAGGEAELRSILREIPLTVRPDEHTRGHFREWLGNNFATDISELATDTSAAEAVSAHVNGVLGGYLVEYADEYRESELRLRSCLDVYSKIVGNGPNETLALERLALGWVLAIAGNYEESERVLAQAREALDASLPPKHHYRGVAKLFLARLRLEQRRPAEAIALVLPTLENCGEGCSERIKAEYLWTLGGAYDQLGQSRQAIEVLGDSLTNYEKSRGPDHIGTTKRRVALADALRKANHLAEASATLAKIGPKALAVLSPEHPTVADLRRVQGLLALRNREFDRALPSLEESLKIFEHRLGENHWRTQRARDELAQAQTTQKAALKKI